jgi:hypothetical protein
MLSLQFSRRTRALLGGAVIACGSTSCASTRVSRVEPNAVTDLSGRWNDTDSRLVANQLIEQTLAAGWTKRYADTHAGEAPAIIVGDFTNRTMEHIAVGTFVKDIESALVNTGPERSAIRTERKDQQLYARTDTRSKLVQEIGARYVLAGELQAIEDVEGRERVVFYQVDASLIDLETNTKVWIGQKKIKKYVERARFSI